MSTREEMEEDAHKERAMSEKLDKLYAEAAEVLRNAMDNVLTKVITQMLEAGATTTDVRDMLFDLMADAKSDIMRQALAAYTKEHGHANP